MPEASESITGALPVTHLEFGWLMSDSSYICDGCMVEPPHEHRCHKSDGAWQDGRDCQCNECNATQEEIEAFMKREGLA